MISARTAGVLKWTAPLTGALWTFLVYSWIWWEWGGGLKDIAEWDKGARGIFLLFYLVCQGSIVWGLHTLHGNLRKKELDKRFG